MEIAEHIDPPDWMRAAEIATLFAALSAEGATVRFVGGCVRDAILGRDVKDIDIATPDTPDKVTSLLEAAHLRAIPTGLDHGTVTAMVDHAHFEVTTLRRDVTTDGRHAEVAFTDDWKEDACRRDFTLNALYADLDGAIYDPTGGLEDLRNGTIRFVGDPVKRIEEDTLRVLRYFRFGAWYGRPPPHDESLNACKNAAGALGNLSAERVANELLRLLEAPNPFNATRFMIRTGIIPAVAPELTNLDALEKLLKIEGTSLVAEDVEPDPILRICALITVEGAPAHAGELAARLRFSKANLKRLILIEEAAAEIGSGVDEKSARLLIHDLGNAEFEDAVMVARARLGEDAKSDDSLVGLITLSRDWAAPELPIRGRDVESAGVEKGPRIGELLREVEAWWIEGDFEATREECLKKLNALL
jgi:poly(A) polymerase